MSRNKRGVRGEQGAGDFPWAQTWPEITDAALRAAFARVPRDLFVPSPVRQWARRDTPLPIGEGQTISQPFIVAWMTQALKRQPGEKTLEIGTGSGYQTAILCELTRVAGEAPGRWVYSVERFPTLARQAAGTLNQAGYFPHLLIGDGALGWAEQAPFRAMIVTAAPAHLPRPLWEQLDEGGRIVIPLGAEAEIQSLWLIHKVQGQVGARNLGDVRFVPLVSPLLNDPTKWVPVP
jgi:protein-L-isoaspartate(D-aspartate) O-methyltransferase